MGKKYKKIFDEIINTIPIWGIDRDFVDLHDLKGPSIPEWIRGKTLYEVYVRAFSDEGTFRKVTERLSRIKKLGIDVIWLMPIYPIGQEQRKGSQGSPYAIKEYHQVNPEMGSAEDFLNLVNKAHDLQMRVVIDMVPNHVSLDYHYLQKHPELVTRDDNGLPTREVEDWSDVTDLDYNNANTQQHMSEIMQYWIRKFDIDGYRCDVAGLIPLSFWEMIISQLKAIKSDFYMLAEWESPGLHKEVFHSTYDWALYCLMLQLYNGRISAETIGDWVKIKAKTYPKNAFPLRFIENHDKPRAVNIFMGKSIVPYLVFLFSIDGIPLVYNGQEIGSSDYPSLFEKEPINWKNNNKGMYKLFKILIKLRKKYISLSSKNYTFVKHNQPDEVLAYIKLGKEKILTIINFKDQEVSLELSTTFFSRIKKGSILFNSKNSFSYSSGKIKLLSYQAVLIRI